MKKFLPTVVSDSGWKHLFRLITGICGIWLLLSQVAQAQVTGTVYRDFNEDGVRQQPGEIGVGGVTVTIYNTSGAVIGTATSSSITTSQGQFSVPVSTTGLYRVQFSGLPSGYYEGPRSSTITGGSTGVQFINAATSPVSATVNYGINYPADYCQALPNVLVPCYVNGDPSSGTIAAQGSLVTLPYNGVGINPGETTINSQGQVGSVFGVAYQRVSKVMFTSAFVKRHSGLGVGGAGAIYITKPVAGTATTYTSTTFTTLPIAASATVASNSARGLPTAGTTTNQDPTVFDQIGKTGLGDLEISEDGTELYTVNLSDRKLYRIPIVNPTSANPTAGTPVSYALPTSQTLLTGSVFRPFAVKYYRGKVYVGGVTTNEAVPTSTTVNFGTGSTGGNLITRDTTGMRAVVYEFNPTTSTFSTSAVLAFSLTYQKGASDNDKTGVDRADHWFPWTDVQPGTTTTTIPSRFARADLANVSYPQPWLTGIEFDVDGSMILSIRDRFGDQYGNNNLGPNGGTQLYRCIAPGDLLRAGQCDPSANKWTIEYNAAVCNGNQTNGANNSQGIGGGEYYYGDYIYAGSTTNNIFAPYHVEMSQGALTQLPGSGEVMSIVLDPYQAYDTGGIRRFNNLTGFGDITTSAEVFASSNVATYGKANGLGDVDLACNVAPIEIGNRLWVDLDKDGIQDANETGTTGLSSLTVTLYQNATLLVGTTTVASDGTYYFNNSNVTQNGATGLLPNTAYQIRVAMGQAGLTGYTLTTANAGSDNGIDNDATISGSNAIINLTTGSYGQNDHSFDIGFTCPSQNLTATNTGPLTCLPSAATVSATASLTGLSYQWNGPGSFVSNATSFTTSSPGTYTVTATGVNGCYSTTTTTVSSNTSSPAVTINSLTLTCGQPTGTLTATASGSNTPFTYRWTGPNNFTSSAASFATATAGTYSLTVTNSINCRTITTTTVTSDTAPPAVSVNSLTLTCDNPTGVFTANVSGASTPYTYQWSGPASFSGTTASVTASVAGAYSVTVTGNNGCSTVTTTSAVSNTVSPTVTVSSLTFTCSQSSGTLTATVSGGTAPYTYVWDSNPYDINAWQSPPITPTVTVGTAGSYSVVVTGANGCTALGTTTVYPNTGAPTVGVNSLTLTCTNPTGTLTATPSGGTGPFTYLWNTAATTQSINATTAGTFSVTVTGANNCTRIATTTVTSSTVAPTVSVNSPTLGCNPSSATVTATVSGGTTPYTYRWTGPASFTSGAASFSTTTAGTYSLTVTGANGCLTTATSTVSSNLTAPTATINSLTLSCSQPSGTLTATASGGTTPYTYRWTGPSSITGNAASLTTSTAGIYSLTVTGNNGAGCSNTYSTTVVANTAPPVGTVNSFTLSCANPTGTLAATVSGGTTPYTYRWTGPASFTSSAASFTTATAGTYSLTVTGANGCIDTDVTTVSPSTGPPTVTINSLTLTCTNTSGTLTATPSGGTGPYTYLWNTTATTQAISANATGAYSVTVTGANGCSSVTGTTVVQTTTDITITNPSGSQTICSGSPISSLTLTTTASTANSIQFVYFGSPQSGTAMYTGGTFGGAATPVGGVVATGPITGPLTINAGTAPVTYYAYAILDPAQFSASCRPSVEFKITINPIPTATASGGGTLTCANTTVTLNGSSNVSNSTYQWSGPNAFVSTAQNPVVSVAGTYTLTVAAGNCSSTNIATVAVGQDITTPQNLTASNTGPLTCAVTNVTISASSSTTGVTYRWSGPASFTSNVASFTTAIAGTYSVTATSANGCISATSTTVVANTAPPVASLNSLTLTCTNPTGTLTATVNGGTSPYTYLWNTTATTQTISATAAGAYSVTVTGANGCSTTATTTVSPNTGAPTVSVNSLTLTCTNPTGTLTATVSGGTAPYSYLWNTTATTQAISATAAGAYSVTVTGANGCSTTATATVSPNTGAPTVSVNSLTLTCTNPTGTLTATTSGGTAPYTYLWNTTATTQAISATAAGAYSVTVTGANGCSRTATTTVSPNTGAPTVSVNSLTLTCTNPTGTLTATTSGGTAPYSYLWNTTATTQTISATAAGAYSVTVTGANGCSTTATTTVSPNVGTPTVSVNSLTLTCTNPTGTLTASVSGGTAPYTYLWNTTATTQAISATAAGAYSVTVTGANGCSTTATATVSPNTGAPTVSVNSLTLTCTNPTGTLTATTSGGTAPYSYLWNTTATTQTISATAAGAYSVTVTGANGCSTTATTTVSPNTGAPTVSVNSLTLTCTNPTGTLTATTSGGTSPYTYLWNTTATTQAISATTAGAYSVTVTGANGCSTTATTTVSPNTGAPTVSVNSLTLTCTNPTGTLTATTSGGTAPYSYLWNTTATTQTISATAAGAYSVTVTGANGCSTTATTTVSPNTGAPTVSVNSLTLTCTNPTGTLTASTSGGTSPYSYLWNTTATTQAISATAAGAYSVTVTGANGCSTTATTTVSPNTGAPTVSVNSLTLTCTNPTGTLTATVSGGTAPYSYLWNTTATTQAISVTAAGAYSVTVTGANGCSTTATTTVSPNTGAPTVSVNSLTLTCTNPTGTLTATTSGGTAPYSYLWNTTATTQTISATAAGAYSVTVTGANGCSTTATTTVSPNTGAPTVSVNSLTLTCTNPTGTLTATTSGGTSPYSYLWNTTATTQAISATTAGAYSVTVTGANGCSTTATTTVSPNTGAPTVSVNSLTLTCANPTGTLTATVSGGTAPYSYLWNTTATTQAISATAAGAYSVTVTGANGCSTTATTTVSPNTGAPTVSVNSLTLTCTNPTGTLTATTSGGTAPYTYLWNTTATTQAISATAAGAYSVTVTGANGCSRTAITTVQLDTNGPNLTASNTGPLTCSLTTVTVNATSSASGVSYRWNGPASFTSNAASFTTSTAGTYSVTATGPNGCVSLTTTTVQSNMAVPTITANSSGTLTCALTTISLTTSVGNATTPAYLWSTGEITSAIVVSNPGIYSVQVTSANGCTAATTVQVQSNAVVLCPIISIHKL